MMTAEQFTLARELASWKATLFEHWCNIKVTAVDVAAPETVQVNQQLAVRAHVRLASLTPADVQVRGL